MPPDSDEGSLDPSAALRLVAERLRANDVTTAFDRLLATWRSLRAPELAEVIEELSDRVAPSLPLPVTAKGSQSDRLVAFVKAYREAATPFSPLALAALFIDFDAVWGTEMQPRFVFPRADALSMVKDDPRVTRSMTKVIRSLHGGTSWQKVMLRAFRGIDLASDPRAIALLEDLAGGKGFSPMLTTESIKGFAITRASASLAKLRATYPNGPPSMISADLDKDFSAVRAAIAALPDKLEIASVTKPQAALDDPATLLAAVYAHPDDDACRLVLADTLLAAGEDPRGELIVLQIRRANGESTPKTIAREKSIIKKHARTLLGPLANVVTIGGAAFERGFLVHCESSAKTQALAELHYSYPEWATVKSIQFHGPNRITPAMKSLVKAGPIDEQGVKALAVIGHPKLETLAIQGTITNKTMQALAKCRALPSLRSLTLNIPMNVFRNAGYEPLRVIDFDWVWNTDYGPNLTHLGVPAASYPEEWAELLVQRKHLESLTLFEDSWNRTTLRRLTDEQGRVSVEVHFVCAVTYARGVAPEYVMEALRNALRRFGNTPKLGHLRLEAPKDVTFNENQQAQLQNLSREFRSIPQITFPFETTTTTTTVT